VAMNIDRAFHHVVVQSHAIVLTSGIKKFTTKIAKNPATLSSTP